MSQYWDSIASRTAGQHTSEELESTAYRLVVEQVLYHADRNSRTAYWMVEQYERDFRHALAPLGVSVSVNRQLRYAYALPLHAKAGTATISQTIFALVLRMIYDESARIGQMNDDGEVTVDLVELDVKYRELTGRDLPIKGKLDALMDTMKRWGIARASYDQSLDGDSGFASQPYVVIIRPAIAVILGEAAIHRLSKFKIEPTASDTPVQNEPLSSDDEDAEVE